LGYSIRLELKVENKVKYPDTRGKKALSNNGLENTFWHLYERQRIRAGFP